MSVAFIRGYNNRYALNDLWGQAFGDEKDFISQMYQCGYLNPSDIFALTEDGRLLAALFLPEYRICVNGEDLPIRLLSCVATDSAQQGKGYMSFLISRALEQVRDLCCGVCVIPVSQELYSFYERFGFSTAFWISEQTFNENAQKTIPLDFSATNAESYYEDYYEKYAKNGFVYKTKERFLQAVAEYTHPTQPCAFCSYPQGFAFLQRNSDEIIVREWTGDADVLGTALASHYHLPVRIQSPATTEDKNKIAMLNSFSDSLTSLSQETNLYLNCMYN